MEKDKKVVEQPVRRREEKEAEKAENSRLWEDWTDCDCGSMTGDNSQSEQLHQEKAQSVCTRNSGKITQN